MAVFEFPAKIAKYGKELFRLLSDSSRAAAPVQNVIFSVHLTFQKVAPYRVDMQWQQVVSVCRMFIVLICSSRRWRLDVRRTSNVLLSEGVFNKTENHFSPYPRLRKKLAINCGIDLHKNN
jgi:hypothetical protein